MRGSRLKPRQKLLIGLFFLSALSGVSGEAVAQEIKAVGRSIFIPPLQVGLADARSRMNDEEFIGCFVTAGFVDDFSKRARLPSTGQSMADLLEAFVCSSSEKITEDRYLVDGTMTVNGETGAIRSELIRAPAGRQTDDKPRWAMGRFELAGSEVFRDKLYEPAN